jgi:hypothetical protein
MMKREERQRKAAEWLEHLQGWKASGQSLSAYVRERGLALCSAYQWRRVLTRDGSWPEGSQLPGKPRAAHEGSQRIPLRFARVTVADSQPTSPVLVRVQLANGRRAEIELDEPGQLGAVLDVLERPA